MRILIWSVVFISLSVIMLGASQMKQAKSIRAIAIDLLERDQSLDRRIAALEQKYASDTLEVTVEEHGDTLILSWVDSVSIADASVTTTVWKPVKFIKEKR